MGGRYGGQIKRRTQRSAWRVSVEVMATIGRASSPDLEAIGKGVRKALEKPKPREAAA